MIFKICTQVQWAVAQSAGTFAGSPGDLRDGFVHLSSAAQVAATAAKHFAGQPDLLLLTVTAKALGEALRWEPARGGDLFPHCHGPLPLAAVIAVARLPLGPDGRHVFPEGVLA